jgi:hypothetical protein
MKGIELFEKYNWEVQYRRSDVIAVSPDNKRYTICYKYMGGTDYNDELVRAFKVAVTKGLITE